jgi:hypothetical protein
MLGMQDRVYTCDARYAALLHHQGGNALMASACKCTPATLHCRPSVLLGCAG